MSSESASATTRTVSKILRLRGALAHGEDRGDPRQLDPRKARPAPRQGHATPRARGRHLPPRRCAHVGPTRWVGDAAHLRRPGCVPVREVDLARRACRSPTVRADPLRDSVVRGEDLRVLDLRRDLGRPFVVALCVLRRLRWRQSVCDTGGRGGRNRRRHSAFAPAAARSPLRPDHRRCLPG